MTKRKRKTQTPVPRPVTATALPKAARVAICLETVVVAAPLEIQEKDLEVVTLKSQEHDQVQALTPALQEETLKDPTLPRQVAVHHHHAVLRRVVAQHQAEVAHH